jgi:hypothetical protein
MFCIAVLFGMETTRKERFGTRNRQKLLGSIIFQFKQHLFGSG